MSRLKELLLNELRGDFGGFTESEMSDILEIMKLYGFKKVDVSRDAVNFSKEDRGDITMVAVSKDKHNKFTMNTRVSKKGSFDYTSKTDLSREVESLLDTLLTNEV